MNFIKADKKALLVWRIRLCIFAFVLLILEHIVFDIGEFWWVLVTAVVALSFLFMFFWYYPLKYRKLSYCAAGELLVINCGVFYTRRKSILVGNIQYISEITTPLLKAFGLCTLFFHAAGGFVYLPCLSRGEALLLQSFLEAENREGDK